MMNSSKMISILMIGGLPRDVKPEFSVIYKNAFRKTRILRKAFVMYFIFLRFEPFPV